MKNGCGIHYEPANLPAQPFALPTIPLSESISSNMASRRELIFNPSNNGLSYRHKGDTLECRDDYRAAPLPSFHLWTDRLHIYFEKSPSSDQGHTVFVSKKLLKHGQKRDATFIRTVTLSQLGFGVVMKRLSGRLGVLYVLCPKYGGGSGGEAEKESFGDED
jgi:hypothetical protein